MAKRGGEILVVDDSPSDVELAVHALRRDGLATSIQVAEDGQEALDYVFCRGNHQARRLADRPNVILLDLKMPRVDGLAVLKQIRADEHTQTIPVVVFTSSKEPQDLIASYKLGANAFVQKPVDFEQFRRTIEDIGTFWLVKNEPPPLEAFAGESRSNA